MTLIVKLGGTEINDPASFATAIQELRTSPILLPVMQPDGGGARFVTLPSAALRETDRFFVTASGVSYNRGADDFPKDAELAAAHILA